MNVSSPGSRWLSERSINVAACAGAHSQAARDQRRAHAAHPGVVADHDGGDATDRPVPLQQWRHMGLHEADDVAAVVRHEHARRGVAVQPLETCEHVRWIRRVAEELL